MPNTLRLDPTRTTTLVQAFWREFKRRMARLKLSIMELIIKEDAFGLASSQDILGFNQRFKFLDDDKKLAAFMQWLDKEIDRTLLAVDGQGRGWEAQFIDRAYTVAAQRVFTKLYAGKDAKFVSGAFQQFMRGGFQPKPNLRMIVNARRVKLTSKNQPRNAKGQFVKMRLLETKTREQMKGMAAKLKQGIGRILTEELSRKTSARQIAKRIAAELDVSSKQASRLVQTEIVSAHAESQLDAMEALDVAQVGAEVEFTTAGDNKVCPQCEELEGEVYTVDEARGIIPVHPNCRCSWRPVLNT